MISIIMYADDGLIYGKEVDKLINHLKLIARNLGTEVHPKKSRWVKEEGKFHGSFKFLGHRYVPGTDYVEGETLNGSKQKIRLRDINEWNFEEWESGKRFISDFRTMSPVLLWHKYKLLGTMHANGRRTKFFLSGRNPILLEGAGLGGHTR
jgi:hypothetical protein